MRASHVVLRVDSYGITVIGGFDTFSDANRYQVNRVKAMRDEETKSVGFRPASAGTMCFFVSGLVEPDPEFLDLPEVKTCGCCEHGKGGD